MAPRLFPVATIDKELQDLGWPLSPWATRKRIREGHLKAVRVGRRLFLTEAQVTEYINGGGDPKRETEAA